MAFAIVMWLMALPSGAYAGLGFSRRHRALNDAERNAAMFMVLGAAITPLGAIFAFINITTEADKEE